ncbi:dihydrofolate reductase [Corticibacter populi]|uniref:Dihydrofolate reductase n=1 Tax=Corticibacter populi TaxID=1550736 RepID=A0A3M6R0E0_9BURK|nr:dihydrofolate reductase [Corticibacter populi]RMX08724.1 dihydrofolate reductase [Corticibacter populi]RZS36074.1 dihydrofolate reductase [Corticibacter populi]
MNSENPSLPRLALIAAVAANGTIGRDGGLPWHLPQDLQYFKARTSGHRIIMGRRTWESFPRPLPRREHVVISSQALALPEGVHLVRGLDEALCLPFAENGAMAADMVFVIGGSQVYRAALPLATDLFLTEIGAEVEGDTRFPDWDRTAFVEVAREAHAAPLADGVAAVPFAFVHYRRR